MIDDNNDTGSADGASILDMAELPPQQVTLIRLLLREGALTYAQLCDHAAQLTEPIARPAVDEALSVLMDGRWIALAEGGDKYTANLRRKATRLPNKRGTSSLPLNIWDSMGKDKPDEDDH